MKPKSNYFLVTLLAFLFVAPGIGAQTIGTSASAVWITNCSQSDFFNTSSNKGKSIGPAGNNFAGANLGVHTQNAGTLLLNGAELHTFKTAPANICSAQLLYRIFRQSAAPGAFTSISLPLLEDCNTATGEFPTGGNCNNGDQKWNRIMAEGSAAPFAPVNLTALNPGNYTVELFYKITGSSVSASPCNEEVVLNNSGNNYTASFSIQAPWLSSANPITCNGSEGAITINGLIPSVNYIINYIDDGTPIGPLSITANSNGEVVLNGLNAGLYSDIVIQAGGCATDLNADLVLSGAIITPRFNMIPSFCAGATAPALQPTSNNGINGTWSPAVINNQFSGTYTFTPLAGQCAKTVTVNVTVKPNVVPQFSFGSWLNLCGGAAVPSLPSMSTNGIKGSWSPSVVDNAASGNYIFTPSPGQCATATSLSVTINPNITPVFQFGSLLSFCAGEAVPDLPTTSANGITGSWSKAVIDNQASGVYIFTPTPGLCANTASLSVTIKANLTPVFAFGSTLTICNGEGVPALPTLSTNGITGTWNPSSVDNKNSGTYTFTPDRGQCASPVTFSVIVNKKLTPTFSFGTELSICADGTVPSLPATSENGIGGAWNPGVVDNKVSGVYTFTPADGTCATTGTFNVSVTPNVTPVFSFGTSLNICEDSAVPTLSNTSDNGIAGSWTPSSVDPKTSATYTFTPSAGQCATVTIFEVIVNKTITPLFDLGSSLIVCTGGAVPNLPTTSLNNVLGTWSPATVSNESSGTYTFTPRNGECATPVYFAVQITKNIRPMFSMGTALTICAGSDVPALPATSTNDVKGVWSPNIVDNSVSGIYTFTPEAGQCALQTTFTVTVNENLTPQFSFSNNITLCKNAAAPQLNPVSINGIKGTWSGAAVSNQASGTYTFTPDGGQCAEAFMLSVTVSEPVLPTFSIGTSLSVCSGEAVPLLPDVDENGIEGTWNKGTIDNTASDTYIFTPSPVAGKCFVPAFFEVTVTPIRAAEFDFGTALSICAGNDVKQLVLTSKNGIAGTWSPAEIDNHTSGTYTFTPLPGQCATGTSLTVTVNENEIAAFDFGTEMTICSEVAVPALPNISANGIKGTWSPSTIDNKSSNVYNFTPDAGQCAIATSFSVTVKPNDVPTFDFGTALNICAGNSAPLLPGTSANGITGLWSAEKIDTAVSTSYTFIPDVLPGQCIAPTGLDVTINPRTLPAFSFGTTATICDGSAVPLLPATSLNGVTGKWTPEKVDNKVSGIYTFTSADGQCAVPEVTYSVTVNQLPVIADLRRDTTVTDGANVPAFIASSSMGGVSYTWNNTNANIGLVSVGTGSIPAFTSTNKGSTALTGTVTLVPLSKEGCTGLPLTYNITVLPLSKDVFVPNVFSPNGDGKNDVLLVYGNYIGSIQMRIFNQWGQQVAIIDNPSKGWDGNFKGKPSTVGVYVYVFEAVLKDGKTVQGKGNITLLR